MTKSHVVPLRATQSVCSGEPLKTLSFLSAESKTIHSLKRPAFGLTKLILVGGCRRPGGPPQDSRLKRSQSSNDCGRRRHRCALAALLSPPAGLRSARPLRGRGAPGRGRRPVEQSDCAHKRGYDGQSEAASAVTRAPRARSIYRSYLKSPWESPRAPLGGDGGGLRCCS